MRNLLALLLFVPFIVMAQVPTYVPADGLVAWYPLDGNALDLSGLGHHGIVNGPMPSVDRFGNPNGAYHFNDASSISANLQGVGNGNVPVTISSWVHIEQTSTDVSYVAGVGVGDAPYNLGTVFGMGEYGGSGLFATMAGSQFDAISGTAIPLNQWVMLTAVHEGDGSIKLYVDSTEIFSFLGSTPNIQFDVALIGTAPWGGSFWSGNIDEVGIWSRALTEEEVQALFLGAPIQYGCTDPQACNYDQDANADDGFCGYGCLYCGEGTVWDSTLAQCISIADTVFIEPEACAPSCGEGTVWDPVNEECIIAIPADLNYDGCVSVNDLLVLLAVHGTCPPYPEWPDTPTDTTWACGDPLTYWDYDYTTVQIGDQCWFAENLQTLAYSDGSLIQTGLDDSNWASTNEGAVTTYGSGSSPCFSGSPDFEACDDTQSLSAYGRLYNWHSVLDSRNICPINWHVSSDEDWFSLEEFLGLNGFSGAEGLSLKSESGWANGGNGPDQFGFTALPGGVRNGGGIFDSVGIAGAWWTSTPIQDGGWRRDLYWSSNNLIRLGYPDGVSPQGGFSVRCVKD